MTGRRHCCRQSQTPWRGYRQRHAEESLLESERKLQAITDAASDAIVLIDDEEKIVYWNSSANKMLGYRFEEVEGQSIQIVIPSRYRETHTRAFAGLLDRAGNFSGKDV